jgi:hypothetical protein
MIPNDRSDVTPGPFTVEFTLEEILEELAWPGPPPGQWLGAPSCGGPIEDADTLLERIENAA